MAALAVFPELNGDSSMRTFNLSLLVIVSTLAACTTMGTGVGTQRSGDMKANFAWKSTDDRTGTLTANLSNGDTYSGQFFQVTHDTRVESLAPLWNGWAGPWHGGWRPG